MTRLTNADQPGRTVWGLPGFSPIWRLQLESAPGYCGPTYHRSGVEVATKAVHQHCTAEGICY